nr:hypothetical protein [Planctomycetota bacterium]
MSRRNLGLFAGTALLGLLLAVVAWGILAFQSRELSTTAQDGLAEQIAADAAFAAALIGRIDLERGFPPLDGRRITVVGPDGRVLADTAESAAAMDNHDNRPEIVAARAAPGTATVSRRRSETVGRTMLYAAYALPDGRVVRVATPLPDDAVGQNAPFAAVLISTAAMIALCYLVVL